MGRKSSASADAPLVLSSSSRLSPYAIWLANNLVFDLGAGNSLLATNRVYFNANRNVTLKSGTLGVDWDSAAGERFFMGDNTANGGTITVDGPDAILSSSYKNTIQVGTNMRGYTLRVQNGGTVRGNVLLGWNNQSGTTKTRRAATPCGSKAPAPRRSSRSTGRCPPCPWAARDRTTPTS